MAKRDWWGRGIGTAVMGAPGFLFPKAATSVGDWVLRGVGARQARPDYGEASRRYRQMLDTSDLEQQKSIAMQDWQGMQERAFGDITRGAAREWGQTGAEGLGIESSIPGQRVGQASSRWMQETGEPAFRGIQSAYVGEQGRRKMAANEALAYEREKAQAIAAGKSGFLIKPLATVAGAGLGFAVGGPAGAGIGAGMGSQIGGAIGGGGGGEWNPYTDPSQPWNSQGGWGQQPGYQQGFDMNQWQRRPAWEGWNPDEYRGGWGREYAG